MSSLSKSVLFVFVISVFLSACASTTLTAVWKDDAFTGGPLKKVLLVAALDNPINRKIVESALADELKQRGVEGIASNLALGTEDLTEDNVAKAAKENQVDALMAVRLTGVDDEQVYHPPTYAVPYPYYYTWGTYYPRMQETVGMPGYTANYKYYNVETNIYEVHTGKLIWSAASQTVDPRDINKEAKAFADKIVGSLKAGGLI